MKTKIYPFNLAAIALLILLQISGCGDSGSPALSASDLVKKKLMATTAWKLQSAMVDGVDQTSTYAGLNLSFTASNYSSINGGVVWPATGTWSFSTSDGTSISRNDGLVVSVEVTDASLKLSYTWSKTTLGGGRVESIKGPHVLIFTK
jgi:hypothetical protein